jgi:peroxiredoxin
MEETSNKVRFLFPTFVTAMDKIIIICNYCCNDFKQNGGLQLKVGPKKIKARRLQKIKPSMT